MNFCPENSTSVNNITQIIKLLRAKGLMEEAGENRTQKNAVMYRLTNLGKQLLSKCNSEMVVLYELISSDRSK
jgi:DNA-binding PadR family transcriptional regulator